VKIYGLIIPSLGYMLTIIPVLFFAGMIDDIQNVYILLFMGARDRIPVTLNVAEATDIPTFMLMIIK
jgi:hypothetical protein